MQSENLICNKALNRIKLALLNHNKGRKFTFYTVLQFSAPTDVINLCRKTWIPKSGHYGGQVM